MHERANVHDENANAFLANSFFGIPKMAMAQPRNQPFFTKAPFEASII